MKISTEFQITRMNVRVHLPKHAQPLMRRDALKTATETAFSTIRTSALTFLEPSTTMDVRNSTHAQNASSNKHCTASISKPLRISSNQAPSVFSIMLSKYWKKIRTTRSISTVTQTLRVAMTTTRISPRDVPRQYASTSSTTASQKTEWLHTDTANHARLPTTLPQEDAHSTDA